MKYTFDSTGILKDERRVFLTMGEIHYSRVPCSCWKESLLKMKAGGIDVVSTYVIWIHHEEIEGEYDWSGNRNLREFLKTASECGMKVCLRIGPWCHGEVRNGGFPDWLLHKDFEPRTNSKAYFDTVEKWYSKIYSQTSDFINNPDDEKSWNNPVIAIQIENEYGHCGGLYDESGDLHMKTLYSLARKTGFLVHLYTATGWGGARTGGLLPVMGGYCDEPWAQHVLESEPSGNFTFTLERNDHNIGSDHGLGYGITFDSSKFPYLTAELGGGLQVTSHRRTVAMADDIAAVAMVKLGSGVNLLGYYMYHGGTNPEGKLSTLQESRETGFLNDLPVKNYDFRAPVGEFGQITETFRHLKLLSYFTGDFGEELCSLPAVIPEENPLDPKDLSSLRFSYRSNGKKGYLFVNNYVRHQKMKEYKNQELKTPEGKTLFWGDIKSGEYFFVPFNMEFCGIKLKWAKATPFTAAAGKIIFYRNSCWNEKTDIFSFDEDCIESGKSKVLLLEKNDALNLWKISGDRILICGDDSYAVQTENGNIFVSRESDDFYVYPDFETELSGWEKIGVKNFNSDESLEKTEFIHYKKKNPLFQKGKIISEKISEGKYKVNLEQCQSFLKDECSDCFVKISYIGDKAELYSINEKGEKKLVLDHFFMGEQFPWEIGLKYFDSSENLSSLELEITPLSKSQEIYLEKWPEFSGEKAAVLKDVSYELEWKSNI